jgi:hypothetical protein
MGPAGGLGGLGMAVQRRRRTILYSPFGST